MAAQSLKGLTPKQKEVLDFIFEFSGKSGYAPSQQEIAKHFGFKSLGTVQNYLVRLERHGFLRKTLNAKRSMEVIHPQPTSDSVPLPLLGRVAAGQPIEAIANQDTLNVPTSMLHAGEHFVLKVSGDSMIEDGILDGDFVVVKKQQTAVNGQTVVALLENEATVKRYYRRGEQVELHPANQNYDPMVVNSMVESDAFRIQGVLVGLIRQME